MYVGRFFHSLGIIGPFLDPPWTLHAPSWSLLGPNATPPKLLWLLHSGEHAPLKTPSGPLRRISHDSWNMLPALGGEHDSEPHAKPRRCVDPSKCILGPFALSLVPFGVALIPF